MNAITRFASLALSLVLAACVAYPYPAPAPVDPMEQSFGAAMGALIVLTLRTATAAVAHRLTRTPLRPFIGGR